MLGDMNGWIEIRDSKKVIEPYKDSRIVRINSESLFWISGLILSLVIHPHGKEVKINLKQSINLYRVKY